MLKSLVRPIALISLGLPLMAAAADTQSELERHISYIKGEAAPIAPVKPQAKLFGRQTLATTSSLSGTLTAGKLITYDVINYTAYNEEPTDTTTFNMVMAGYSPSGPTLGSVSPTLSSVRSVAFARVVKLFNPAPFPEADLMCNLLLTSSDLVQGLNIDGTYFPLTQVGSSVKSGTTYYDYATVALDKVAPNYTQYFLDEHAFCTTFDSFNSTYPNGSTVSLTLVP
ncbi:hypothetical protein PSGK_18220 [Pseudomonas solani]|uniref:hypothetical protein n=1 Tax=Pseudomonas solani TaxID=2731552 RepID=UPI0035BE5565